MWPCLNLRKNLDSTWKNVSIEESVGRLNNYLPWYNDVRIKESLGYLSPTKYRQSLGLTA